MASHPHSNRLAAEASPYLLQHAHNPVDWHPWGPEALGRAKREDRPILLSIGYSACHWCHVMERESFEDEAIAAQMNELFVNIKVDREERPDLDQIYQLVVQIMGRSGGWPLTVFLTPDQRPFFAGTYFPPKDRYGMSGFPKVLSAVADAFKNRRAEVEEQAQELIAAIERVNRVPARARASADAPTKPPAAPLAEATEPSAVRLASRKLLARFDSQHGGFGGRPKFPNTMGLDVLLRRGKLENDSVCAESVELALDKMRAGGIWDHLRGGFHRYSTDERWLVPHFEKMLYDNALLLRLYTDGFRAFNKPVYRATARSIVEYIFAEMTAPSGGFYSSQDADSEGSEGKFFVWKLGDLRAAVGDDARAYDVARIHFGITEEGNFEESGATVLAVQKTIERTAAILDISVQEAEGALARATAAMLSAREARPRPLRDDKILASWNGLMIGALADAGRTVNEPSWIDGASRAFDALAGALITDGRVGRYMKDGVMPPSGRRGFLDDQALMGNAALDLFEATGEPRYAEAARRIADAMIEHHWDKAAKGFYFTPDDGEAIVARTQELFDHAVPSSASMAALLCMRVGELVGGAYHEAAEAQLAPLHGPSIDNPFGMGQTICVLDRLARGATSIVIVGERGSAEARALQDAAFQAYLPNRAVVTLDPARPESLAAAPALAEGKPGAPGRALAYVCRGRSCSAPIDSAADLRAALRG